MRRADEKLGLIGKFFLYICLIALIMGAVNGIGVVQAIIGGVRTEGVVSADAEGELRVRYEAEGQEYFAECSMKLFEGARMQVHYRPDQPEKGRVTESKAWSYSLLAGGLFSAVGWAFGTANRKRLRLMKELAARGIEAAAQITRVEKHHSFVLRTMIYDLDALCMHPVTGREVSVHCDGLLFNPAKKNPDGTVKVLFDPEESDKYYVNAENQQITGYHKEKAEPGM